MSKKILIVSDFYYPHKSGIVTYIDQIINSIKNKDYNITVLTTKNSSNLLDNEKYQNIQIIRCKPTIKISRGLYSIELVLKFIKIYKNYNIVNVHLPLVEIFPIIFFLKKNQSIINYHCLPEFKFIYKIFKFYFFIFGLVAIKRSKNNIVLSKDYFKSLKIHDVFKNKTIEIPPYIKLPKNFFKSINQNKIYKIGYLGRISPEKGLEYLIRVSNKLSHNNINHKIIIAGDDNDKRFIKYIKYLKKISNENIQFIGLINNIQKENFYLNIDTFVLPSINSFEAFGIVQLEAMSYGIPVIAANIFGVRSVITKTKNGYLFQKENSNDLYNKIILAKDSNFNKNTIRENVYRNYNKNDFDNKIKKLF